jgi:multidrug efflux pump subunit AcrA (membrane-fusion protein)
MKRWIIAGTILITLLLIAGAGYLGLRGARERAGGSAAPIEGPPTVRVTRGDVQQTVIAPGVLVDTRAAAVGARLGGELAELLVRPGDAVQAGEVVARLRVDDLRRQIAEAEGELVSAQLALQAADRARLRQIAALELDLAAAQARVNLAETEQAEALAGAGRRPRAGHGHRHPARGPAAPVQALSPGQERGRLPGKWAGFGHRPGHRRAQWRHGGGRGRRAWGAVRAAPAAARRRGHIALKRCIKRQMNSSHMAPGKRGRILLSGVIMLH